MSFHEQLEQAKAGFIARVPEAAQVAIVRHMKEQVHSGIIYGLNVGDKAPDFTLTNTLGELVNLYEVIAQGPVILTFYRGGWCPFCNIQLRAFQHILPEIHKLGAQLIAISPQSPDNAMSQQEKEQLTFLVLSDPNGLVSQNYNLLFELPDYLQNTFVQILKRNLAEFNQSDRWVLPVPATYIIDRSGIIQFVDSNPDFMARVEPQVVIDSLKKLT